MPNCSFGAENLGTPIGDRETLERKAKEINIRERQVYIAKRKAHNPDWNPKEEELIKI